MATLATRPRIAALMAAAALVLAVPAAQAQTSSPNFRINPFVVVPPASLNINTMNRFVTANPLFGNAAPVFNPYMASAQFANGYGSSGSDGSGWGNPYLNSYNPWGGAFSGYADVINAQGRFMVNREQSFGIREQTKQAKIDTRRRIFDEWQYERANTPSLEDLREQDIRMARRRALNDPPFTEILAGTSLNTLLDHLKTAQGTGARGNNVAMDEDTLKRVNVTSGSGGNIGLLKNDGFVQWPLTLRAEEFNPEREAITKALPKLVQDASTNGHVDAGTLKAAQSNLDKLNERLTDKVGDLGTSQYIESRRYLNFLGQALQALGNDDVANFFNQRFTAKGKTVAELVKHMSDKGLRFAPATPGDEAAYRAMHQALVNYDLSISQNVAEKDTKDPYKDK
jgi:hypothetical protein